MSIYGVIGCGGFGREVMPLVPEGVFVDDAPQPRFLNGHPTMPMETFLTAHEGYFAVAIAEPSIRRRVATRCLDAGLSPFCIAAQNSLELHDAQIGHGYIVCPFAMVTSNVRIGRFFQANIYSYVAHDCVVGEFVTLGPHAGINGRCIIGDGVYIGAGAMIRNGVTVGAGAVIGMSAVVVDDVPDGETWVGNPARRLR
jgi:sugar O-acyltransferase (sialic acid O-acetyltransferase NeuD family)